MSARALGARSFATYFSKDHEWIEVLLLMNCVDNDSTLLESPLLLVLLTTLSTPLVILCTLSCPR